MEYTFTRTGTYYLGVSAAANNAYDPVTGTGDRPGQTTGYAVSLYDHGNRPPAPAGPDGDDQFSEARTMSRTDAETIDDSISSPTDVDLYHFITAPVGGPFLTISNRDAAATDL